MAPLLHTRPNWPSARPAPRPCTARVNVHGTRRLTRRARCIIDEALIYRRDKDPRPRYNPLRALMSVGCYRLPVCGPRLGHRIHYQRPTKCRYARVDKAAPADYTITSCRETESTRNLVDSKHTKLLQGSFAATPFSRTRAHIGELRGNPVGLRFRYFRSFRAHRPSYRTRFFFF